ncbi:probable cationic amino acid transporter [Lates japonicus]|uniref:Probable cationic amino acid transporter n=1 Tax=Lates japonicus TaxID=270547 RepID=A0AAD3NIW0_LATJO|nr:probable cationic amino acid transporter [Lates japonicus]
MAPDTRSRDAQPMEMFAMHAVCSPNIPACELFPADPLSLCWGPCLMPRVIYAMAGRPAQTPAAACSVRLAALASSGQPRDPTETCPGTLLPPRLSGCRHLSTPCYATQPEGYIHGFVNFSGGRNKRKEASWLSAKEACHHQRKLPSTGGPPYQHLWSKTMSLGDNEMLIGNQTKMPTRPATHQCTG